MPKNRLSKDFFLQKAISGAPSLIGKILVRKLDNNEIIRARIVETECYMGEEDKACHASKGKTPRNSVIYEEGGLCYIYLCYGMHNLMNVVFGEKGSPEAALIRGVVLLPDKKIYDGPGKLTKALEITKYFNKENLITSERIWLEDDGFTPKIKTAPRIGIDYAEQYWRDIHWRFIDESVYK